jgi:hypothetical protein
MQLEDLIKDYYIILVRNIKGISIWNKVFYFLIRLCINSRYNHGVILKKEHGVYQVYESNLNGFNNSKSYEVFLQEQEKYQRELLYLSLDTPSDIECRFNTLLGNKYNARYWNYLLGIRGHLRPSQSTNCFQSIGYIFNLKGWWKIKPNEIMTYNK